MKIKYTILQQTTVIDYLESFHLSKSKIYKLFLEGNIKVNGENCQRKTILNKNDILEIDENENIDFKCYIKRLDIIYEDDYLLILNKPAHLLIHNDSKEKDDSLCNMVAYYYQVKGYDLSIKYAHRLDFDTTGIIIFCKDMLTMAYMNYMISKHEIKRYYLALVSGKLKNSSGTINLPIGEDRHHKSRRRVSKTGDIAITHYQLVKQYKDYALVFIRLQTGRTHQIRVHFSHLGHPLLGDELYFGSTKYIKRTALHSFRLEFIHPVSKKEIILQKNIPYDMKILVGDVDVDREVFK